MADMDEVESSRSPADLDEIWLYLSGGGLRSALGSLGVVYYLLQSGQWSKVTRITSVSGGTLTNASLALAEVRDLASGVNRPLAAADEADVRRWLTATFQRMIWFGRLRSFGRTMAVLTLGGVIIWLLAAFMGGLANGLIRGIVLAGLSAALLQIVFTLFAADRMGYLIGSGRRYLSTVESSRLHIVATTDVASGEPAYATVRQGRARLAHDQSESSDRIRFYDAGDTALRRIVYGAAALPFAVLPMFRRFRHLNDEEARDSSADSDDVDVPVGGHDVEASTPGRRWFALMDGGLNSTLGSRLDPELVGLPGEGTMGLIAAHHDLDDVGRPPTHGVLRVVVDGGRYLAPIRYAWLSGVPILSALLTTHRSIKVSNNSLISTDRLIGPVAPYRADSTAVDQFRDDPALVGPRWPLPGHKTSPLAVSHRGVPVGGKRPDQRSIAAIHPLLGRVGGRPVSRMGLGELRRRLGAQGSDLATLPELVTGLVSDDSSGGRVLWNVEAKRRHTGDALIHWLAENPDAPVLVSGGWNAGVLRSVRAAHPTVPTAASLGEVLRLLVGRRVPQVAVVQLPWMLGPIARWAARNARGQGIRVHWWTVKTAKQAARILDRNDCRLDGLMADEIEVLEYLGNGAT